MKQLHFQVKGEGHSEITYGQIRILGDTFSPISVIDGHFV